MSDIERIFDRISTRLNNVLCEMKPGYDDSIVGFNEAWDVMRAVFKDEMAKATNVLNEPQTAREDIAQALCGADGNGFLCDCTPTAREAYMIRADAVLALLSRPQQGGGE